MSANLVASIHARLLNRAKARGEDFNLILTRYALERFLYRLSLGPAREIYWLKGAMLFDLWFDVPHRPTRDADFLGFGPIDSEALAGTVREICDIAVDDGMVYDPDSITEDYFEQRQMATCSKFGRKRHYALEDLSGWRTGRKGNS